MRYHSAQGVDESLELDLNYLFRVSLWPTMNMSSVDMGDMRVENFPVINRYELFAGKLAALFSRRAGRDLFDVRQMLKMQTWDANRFRLVFILYGAMNRKDWRTISLDSIAFDHQELQQSLLPVLRRGDLDQMGDIDVWASRITGETQEALGFLFPFKENEREFLNRLLDAGKLVPSLLTEDKVLQSKILQHPVLQWKAINVQGRH